MSTLFAFVIMPKLRANAAVKMPSIISFFQKVWIKNRAMMAPTRSNAATTVLTMLTKNLTDASSYTPILCGPCRDFSP